MLCVKVYILWSLFLITHLTASPLQPITKITQGVALNEFIRHWEPAIYDVESTRTSRHKRSLNKADQSVRIQVKGHGRTFRLKLRHDQGLFAQDAEFESPRGKISFDPQNVYTGHLEDDETASVHGLLTSEGLFDGTISTNSDHFYIEPLSRYFTSNQTGEPPPFHSIIYKHSDVIHPQTITKQTCASEKLRQKHENIHWSPNAIFGNLRIPSDTRNLRSLSKDNIRERSEKFDKSSDTQNLHNLSKDTVREWSDNFKERRKSTKTQTQHHSLINNIRGLSKYFEDPRINFDMFSSQKRTYQNLSQNNIRALLQNFEKPQKSSEKKTSSQNNIRKSSKSFEECQRYLKTRTNQKLSKENVGRLSENLVEPRKLLEKGTAQKLENFRKDLWKENVRRWSKSFKVYRKSMKTRRDQNMSKDTVRGLSETFRDVRKTKRYPHNIVSLRKPSENLRKSSENLRKSSGNLRRFSKDLRRYKRWLPDDIFKNPHDDLNFWHPNNSRHPLNPPFDLNTPYNQGDDDGLLVFSGNRTLADLSNVIFRHVNKRATVDPKKTTCMLYLQADHQFFQKYGTEEACIEVMTRHVQRVNSIYKTTDFNLDQKADNITFMIKRIKVHTSESLKDPLYRFPGNYGVEKFLELFSEEDYDAFCLAYMFTYRDFEMGTLGLAWTGDLKNAGGVCEKNGHYRGSMKSLNTGIVTLLNYGKHVPPAVSHVTLAHEIGHNFGSPHDPELCTPGGEDGNYIMFARATSGDKKNNNHFSPCSIKSINPVLNFKARSPKGCFTEPQTALCGNGVVEAGEECDCGWEEDCRDECCFPQRRYPPPGEKPCTLAPRSICSPSQGPCCTNKCQLKFGYKCRDDNGCRDASYCNGRNPQCPPSVNKPNKTICNDEFVCFMGECTGSICLAYGLESCQCIPGAGDSPTKACELCCKLPGDHQQCISSFEWNDTPYDIPDMYSKPGTPCNDYNGYCDVFQKCREVDPSGPLATLRKMLLSEESIASFKKWVMDHWYAVALIIFGVFTLIVLSTKLLGKRPNIKQKSVTIIHNSTTETVRLPPDDTGQVTVHPAVRSKLPLKMKVRESKIQNKKRRRENSKNNNNNSPKKQKRLLKKKKRVSAPVGAEEAHTKTNDAMIEVPSSKVKKSPQHVVHNKKKKKKKEVIDYSTTQAECEVTNNLINAEPKNIVVDTDPFGKVQNWLLRSQLALPKSKSTPAGLTSRNDTHRRPRVEKTKTVSVGNLTDEKVRLQVIYKPPFKFSLKLRKPDKTSIVVDPKASIQKAKQRKQRTGVLVKKERPERNKDKVKKDSEVRIASQIPTTSKVVPNVVFNNTTGLDMKPDDIDSNIHTVQSDLEVLLSESEFLFSDN